MFKVTVERDVEAERKVLEALPRDQIVETLLRAQVSRVLLCWHSRISD